MFVFVQYGMIYCFYMMIMKFLKFIVGILILPLCVAITLTVVSLVLVIQPDFTSFVPPSAIALGIGFFLWLFLYFVLPHPLRAYILAHELTHVLWNFLMGGSVSGIHVAADHGSVELSKSNFLITLAPYFFPLYTVLTVLIYYVLTIFFDLQNYYLFLLGVVGFTWGFHLTFTISALSIHQPDIREHGRLFSYSVIYFMNAIGIALWIVMVSSVSLDQLIGFFHDHTVAVFYWIELRAKSLELRVDYN